MCHTLTRSVQVSDAGIEQNASNTRLRDRVRGEAGNGDAD